MEDEIIVAKDLEALPTGFGYEVVGIASTGAEAILLSAQFEQNLLRELCFRIYTSLINRPGKDK